MGTVYGFFSHTADIGLEITGENERKLFTNAAYALIDLITERTFVSVKERRYLQIEGEDRTALFVNFLREILYLMEGEWFFIRKISAMRIEEARLRCRVEGEKFVPSQHVVKREIKAVTYHSAEVSASGKGWKGRVILDV